jgi:hypothetical protein
VLGPLEILFAENDIKGLQMWKKCKDWIFRQKLVQWNVYDWLDCNEIEKTREKRLCEVCSHVGEADSNAKRNLGI